MRTAQIKVVAAVVVAGMLWAFVGVERIVDDHEIGISWEPFVKHRPSLQVRFVSPAQKGLEIAPTTDDLSPSERAAFIEFCGIRFGVTDPAHCHAIISRRGV